MKIRLLVGVILYVTLISCSNKPKMEIEEMQLQLSPLTIDSLTIGQAYGMLLVDSNLLIVDRRSDSLFHWVNLNNFTYRDIGRIGQGPDEFLHFDNFYSINGKYGFYDRRLRYSNDILFSEHGISLNKNVGYKSLHYKVVPTAFDTFIGIGPYEKGLFSILDSRGDTINIVGL